MKPWRRLTVLVCAVAALLALPAGAGAQSGVEVHPGSFALEVELPESQGLACPCANSDRPLLPTQSERAIEAAERAFKP